ncbi:hypothetical protein [Agromyces sp. Soil535]|uniref:hypothetical protein n=1 Tax=Agromyces sp. Soil535 TaxID=1736390 RepID=UPI0006FEA285|nr:hypothetical protein [Agromyces sp. Soil535]KRE25848.1 hypothetical protein ASG80_21920 [Agromyces sp. Soil535]
MSITTSTLTRAAAVASMVAGLVYILIQPLHPSEELASVTGNVWVIVHALSFSMAILGLTGVTGIYLRQVREFGVIGLIGYVLFSLFFILQAAFTFAEAFIAPLTAAGSPELTVDLVGLFAGHEAVTDLGPLAVAAPLGALFYIGGGLLFGVAVLRARILSRGAAILLIAASAITPLAAVLPHEVERLLAIPVGVALTWLGYSLWSEQRKSAGSSGKQSADVAHTPAA